MAEVRVVYDDFSVGEYGHAGGANAPDGSFTGRNVFVYRSGMIGPRPGIKASTIGGTAGTLSNAWRGIQDGSGADADVWTVTTAGTVRFKKRSPGGYSFTAGALTGAVTASKPPQATHLGLGKYALTNILDRTYIVDLTAMSGSPPPAPQPLVEITDSPGCSTIATYNSRLFVANNGTSGGFRRVFYTEPAVYTTFPAANYFDVPSKSGVAALVGQKDHLAILMEDGSWWVFRGSGTSASLRKVTSAEWPYWTLNHNSVTNLTDDLIVQMTSLGDWPATFDGSVADHLYLHGPNGDGVPFADGSKIKVLRNLRPTEATIILPDTVNGARIYLSRNGSWTIHTLPTNISHVASSIGSGNLLLSNNTTPYEFYEFDINLDRPGFVGDTFARPGDLSDAPINAHFTLPEWWSKPGTETRVRQVIVDFVKFNTGAAANNNLTLSVSCFGMFANDGTEAPAIQSWSESPTLGSTTGVRDRAVFNVGEQGFGAGFQIGLTAIVGVAIRAITVVLDSQPSSPRV